MKKIPAIVMMAVTNVSFAADEIKAPANQGGGTIRFVGSIIDAPCTISQESVDQTIEMGQISNSLLEQQGEGVLRPFEIKLENCASATAKKVTVYFNGISDDTAKTRLAINGTAKGAAIAIVNQIDGSNIALGTPTKAVAVLAGENHLKFGAKLVSNLTAGSKATPGEFSAIADFVMSYQ
ncbi:fimbrial protein [Vibrio cholerae]